MTECPECTKTHDMARVIIAEASHWYEQQHAARARVGFSYAKGPMGLFSRLIMRLTDAPCSHVWLLYWDRDFDCDMVMEAHTEWRLVPFADFQKRNHVVAVYEPSQPVDVGLRAGGRLLGTVYDVSGLLGSLVVIVGGWLKRRWRNPFRSTRSVFCSEGVARVLSAAEYPGVPADPNSVQPGQLLLLFERDGSKRWTP